MKGNRRNQPAAPAPPPPPASPTAKGTAKYTNKDGSKFITVPKSAATEPARPSSPAPSSSYSTVAIPLAAATDSNGVAPPVNRKKAKRRAKAAAKAMAEQAPGDHLDDLPSPAASASQDGSKRAELLRGDGEVDDSDDGAHSSGQNAPGENGHDLDALAHATKSKKKKKKGNDAGNHGSLLSVPQRSAGISKEKIWNTSSQEERERIKEFWLGLGEEERKSLVKVEKDAVLKKMKEQQKHTCGCTVCGRKRNAIEEELEGLYDAYYEELEQFANDPSQQGQMPPMMGPPRHYGEMQSHARPSSYSGQQPSRGRIMEHIGDDEEEDGDEDYSDEELDDEEDYSEGEEEDIPPEELHRDYGSDFLHFGNSLTVQGGILTVADDLLKNDGRKFIDMMEQLAERRMAREEDTRQQFSRGPGYAHNTNSGFGHNQPPSEEEDYGPEDEEDEEYDDSQEEEYEEEDVMTEEQRMEEGRRMFQIFAARMFEQRVLTAYREKVAKERQEKLLEELADEETQESQRKAKKAKEAQKRKDKAAQKKQALAEEKVRKEAEKAAELAERQADEARKAEEQRVRTEDKRKKKEAQKKAEEEERLRKEAERQRRAHEQKERQAELERKAREAKEREKKAREDARLKEKEARERKEREARERREKQERDKREKDARARANEAKEKQRQEERAAQKAAALSSIPSAIVPITLPKRPSQQPGATMPHQHQHQHQYQQQHPAGFASPQVPVAAPALPKAPTPMRPRQTSQQGGSVAGSRAASQTGSGQSQNPSPNPSTPIHTSPGALGLVHDNTSKTILAHSQTSPLGVAVKPAMQHPGPFNTVSPAPFSFPMGMPPSVGPPPGFGVPAQFGPHGGGNYRAPGPAMSMPPGINGPGRAFSAMGPPPGFGASTPDPLSSMGQFGSLPKEVGGPLSHSRQPSGGFDSASPVPSTQPIARPGPIGRPGSVVQGQRSSPASTADQGGEAEDPYHLGSKALVDDSEFDELLARRAAAAAAAAARPSFGHGLGSFAIDSGVPFSHQSPLWNNPPPQSIIHNGPFAPVAPPGGFHIASGIPGAWGPPTNASLFAPHGSLGRSQPRSTALRRILCEACRGLSETGRPEGRSDAGGDDFVPLDAVRVRVDVLAQSNLSEPVQETELTNLFDTVGDAKNGGGSFDIRRDVGGLVTAIRWIPDSPKTPFQHIRVGGEANSPALGSDDGSASWNASR